MAHAQDSSSAPESQATEPEAAAVEPVAAEPVAPVAPVAAPLAPAAPAAAAPQAQEPVKKSGLSPAALAAQGIVQTDGKQFRFRGSWFSYSQATTPLTLAPGAQPHYNPMWSHSITLAPQFNFTPQFFTRARLFISQELTWSDETSRRNEVEVSDVSWDFGTTGYLEKVTGLRIMGDVRFTFPTSKLSQMRTQVMTIGPSATLLRRFNVLSGLTIGYSARPTVLINRFTTGQVREPTLAACIDVVQSVECAASQNTGGRNSFFNFSHGPMLSFQPIDTVSFDMSFGMTRAWLYKVTPSDVQSTQLSAQADSDAAVRDITRFVASLSWQFSQPVGISFTSFTVSPQLAADGRYTFPLFNRNTVFYLDATVDIESVVSKLF